MDMTGKYVDGFVVPVPKGNIDAYKKMSETMGSLWKEHGALCRMRRRRREARQGHVLPAGGRPQGRRVVVFSWIVYETREQRDRVNAAVMSDPRIKMDPKTMPF